MFMTEKTSERIIKYIEKHGEATPKELAEYLGITNRATFKQLAKLSEKNQLVKVGTPPKVFYRLQELPSSNKQDKIEFDSKTQELLDENYLYISPLGDYFEGVEGFLRWCETRNLNPHEQANQYKKIVHDLETHKDEGLIDASDKLTDSFEESYLDRLYYIDFYSVPQFGKTKLGQLLLYAKQSQDLQRIKIISEIARPKVEKLIEKHEIKAIGYVPPTVKREVQFMKELEKNLQLKETRIRITKVRTEIIVPQKTLSKLPDRINNARNTIIVEDRRTLGSVLLIDDAVGSGATLNETAKKIREQGVAQKIIGLAITGSYKGFDVISEV